MASCWNAFVQVENWKCFPTIYFVRLLPLLCWNVDFWSVCQVHNRPSPFQPAPPATRSTSRGVVRVPSTTGRDIFQPTFLPTSPQMVYFPPFDMHPNSNKIPPTQVDHRLTTTVTTYQPVSQQTNIPIRPEELVKIPIGYWAYVVTMVGVLLQRVEPPLFEMLFVQNGIFSKSVFLQEGKKCKN